MFDTVMLLATVRLFDLNKFVEILDAVMLLATDKEVDEMFDAEMLLETVRLLELMVLPCNV